jgi:hypothetical protein
MLDSDVVIEKMKKKGVFWWGKLGPTVKFFFHPRGGFPY